MVIITKNPKLKKKVFAKIKEYDRKAMANYKKGKIKEGKIWEKKSDKIYKDNYNKMFEEKK